MPSRLLNENSSVDGFLLEDGSGVLLMEEVVAPANVPNAQMMMGIGSYMLFLCGTILNLIKDWL